MPRHIRDAYSYSMLLLPTDEPAQTTPRRSHTLIGGNKHYEIIGLPESDGSNEEIKYHSKQHSGKIIRNRIKTS